MEAEDKVMRRRNFKLPKNPLVVCEARCAVLLYDVMVWLMFVYFLAVCLIEFWSRKTPNDQTIDC